EQGAHSRLGIAQRLLGAPALRDVDDHVDETRQLASLVANLRHGGADPDLAAGSGAQAEVASGALAAPKGVPHGNRFLEPARVAEVARAAADHLVHRATYDLRRAAIRVGDHAVEIRGDDPFVSRVDDRAVLLLAVAEHLLVLPALRDVFRVQDHDVVA